MSEPRISDLHKTDQYTSFKITRNNSQEYSQYIKLDKYNVRFRLWRFEDKDVYQLQCQIRDENCHPLTCIQDTVTVSMSVESSPREWKMCITGPLVEHMAMLFDKTPQFKIKLSVTPPQIALNTICNGEIIEHTWTRMYDDETFLDFKLVIKKSSDESVEESVGFHRSMLAAWSPVMSDMLASDWKEKNEGLLKLPVTLEVLKAFKKYIYTYELPADRETLLGLAELGSYYKDTQLEIGASKAISEFIRPGEILEHLGYPMAKKLNRN